MFKENDLLSKISITKKRPDFPNHESLLKPGNDMDRAVTKRSLTQSWVFLHSASCCGINRFLPL